MRVSMLLVGVTAWCAFGGPVFGSRAFADDRTTCGVGNFTARIAACSASIKSGNWRGADLAWAYVNRGQAYFDKGDADLAIADFNEAIRLNPGYADAYVSRSVAYRAKGYNNRAIRLNPAEADRGTCTHELGDTAIAACNRAITSGKFQGNRLASIFENRGIEFSKKGAIERAREDYNEALRLNPSSFSVYNDRGDDYRLAKDYDRAIQDLNEAIRLNPSCRSRPAPTPIATRVTTTAPFRTWIRRSGSTRTIRKPSAAARTSTGKRINTTEPSPITAKRSGSIPGE